METSTQKLTLKQRAWLAAFLDATKPETFMNRGGSARAAGYRCNSDMAFYVIGSQNFKKLKNLIDQWLEENGFSETALKVKALSLMEAKETKFIKVKGAVNPDELLPGFTIVGTTGAIEQDKDGRYFGDGDTVLMTQMDAIEVQRKTLDMGFKVKGLYENDGPGDLTIRVRVGKGE